MIETVTYTCRVQRWSIPNGSPWLPQKWTMKSSRLATDVKVDKESENDNN